MIMMPMNFVGKYFCGGIGMNKKCRTFYEWEILARNEESGRGVRDLISSMSAMDNGATLTPENNFYILGEPFLSFHGSWRATSNITSIEKRDDGFMIHTKDGEPVFLVMSHKKN